LHHAEKRAAMSGRTRTVTPTARWSSGSGLRPAPARFPPLVFVFCKVIEVLYLSNEQRVLLGSDRHGVTENFDRLLRRFVLIG
jgi:hypothetical protein